MKNLQFDMFQLIVSTWFFLFCSFLSFRISPIKRWLIAEMHIGIFVKDKCYSSDFCQTYSCVWNKYVRSEKLFVSEMYGIKYNNYVNIVRNVLVGSVFLVFCGVFVCFVCLRSVSCSQCWLHHSIVHSWSALRFCVLCPMLPVSFVHSWSALRFSLTFI